MGTHTVSDFMLGSDGAEASVFKFHREAGAQQQRDGGGGKREEKIDLRVAPGSGNCGGGFSELCDVACASFEQKMLFWQSVVVDKSEHICDRRSAKYVCVS